MTKRSLSKNVIKDVIIVALGVIVIWIGLQLAFGTENPFYVVASGSMIPELQVYDVLVVQGHVPFEDIKVGDIIVFNRPTGHDRVIVHRVAAILDDNPKTIRTKGDNNVASIPGTDFPITANDYIGKVEYKIPQIGYVTQVLKPPTNYILIVLVIGVMIVKEIIKRKNVKELTLNDPFKEKDPNKLEKAADFKSLKKDSEYSAPSEGKSEDKNSENTVSDSENEEKPY